MQSTTRVSNANMMSFREKLSRFSWPLFIPMCVVLVLSLVVLFSAGGGSWFPFAMSQLLKVIFCLGIFFVISFSNIKFWIKSSIHTTAPNPHSHAVYSYDNFIKSNYI